MAHTITVDYPTGKTVTAQYLNVSNANVGSPITLTETPAGSGSYTHVTATVPAGATQVDVTADGHDLGAQPIVLDAAAGGGLIIGRPGVQ